MRTRLSWSGMLLAGLAGFLLTSGSEIFFRYSSLMPAKVGGLLLLGGGALCLGWPRPRGTSSLPRLVAFVLFLAYLGLAAIRFPGLTKESGPVPPDEILRWSGMIGGAVLAGALFFRLVLFGIYSLAGMPRKSGG